MRVVIVDDEPLARSGVRARLSRFPDVEIAGECGDGRAAVAAIREFLPDLVFLDIQMPDVNGFDVLRNLPADRLPLIIFLTAYDRYAVNAFEVHALDYLLKPIDDERFRCAVEHVRGYLSNQTTANLDCRIRELLELSGERYRSIYDNHFAAQTGQRIVIVPVKDVDWIEANGDYVTLHAGGKSHLLRQTMRWMEDKLDPKRFLRIHRSAIVHASKIRELISLGNREFMVRLSDGTEIRASRNYSERIERWL
ncbi:MAG TPA: LytTR family DNA-binding domain-containing protein [Verrucomicrobiae bacterium]|nr:LytTR family DNA-binding domain-containing protein [Verrucomicrobiae bacterium]